MILRPARGRSAVSLLRRKAQKSAYLEAAQICSSGIVWPSAELQNPIRAGRLTSSADAARQTAMGSRSTCRAERAGRCRPERRF